MKHFNRIQGLKGVMRSRKVDALLVTNIRNIRYLTGFTGSSAFVVVTEGRSFFFTDFRYKEQAESEVQHCELKQEKGKRIGLINNLVKRLGTKVLGFESSVSFDFYQSLRKLSVELFPLDGTVEKLRLVKDSDELENIQEAIRRAEESFVAIKPYIKPGVTERAIALRLENELKRRGCKRIPFDIIVASGKHSSMPHAGQTDKKLERGDFVIIDWGGEAGGYYSDMTRTLLMAGQDIERKRHIYNIVNRAREKAIADVRDGKKGSEIDAAARQHIVKAGYGQYFGHGTGHGIGLDVHEAPRISLAGRETLSSGMVFSIEPGIYLPGCGGVRIEDLVLVDGDKGRTLTKLDRKLEIIYR